MEHATFGVAFLIEHGDIPASYVNLLEGTSFSKNSSFSSGIPKWPSFFGLSEGYPYGGFKYTSYLHPYFLGNNPI